MILIETGFIKNILKKYIGKYTDQFVIYPFGANGVNTRNILSDYYGLQPCLIVDNEYSGYHPDIIDEKKLRQIYTKEMYVILTVEDNSLNRKLFLELSEFVPQENIINLQEEFTGGVLTKNYDGRGFLLKDFLPVEPGVYTIKTDQIRVRIFCNTPYSWNAVKSIVQAFKEDGIFDLVLIIDDTDFTKANKMIQQAIEIKCDYVRAGEFTAETDKPDILILSSYYWTGRKDNILDCRDYAKLIICIPETIVRYYSMDLFLHRLKSCVGAFRPHYYLFDSLLYNDIMEWEEQNDIGADKLIEMGNGKFDGIYYSTKKKYWGGAETDRKKLHGRIVVLWATSHGLFDHTVTKFLTFDLYAKAVFEYINKHEEMGLIFRPHPELISELVLNGFWSQNDINRFKNFCLESPNIVFDDTDTYDNAFSIADGILTDAFCGIAYSALPTLIPICTAYRSENDIPYHPELLKCLYPAYEEKDILNFFEMIRQRQDPGLELRKEFLNIHFRHFDGKNGFRIKEFIKDRYFES